MSRWVFDYLGKPWENGAQGPNAYDCWGLVRAVYREQLGIALPVVDVDAHKPLAVCRAFADARMHSGWTPVDRQALQEFDAIELSLGEKPHHVGIWCAADGGGVLSAVEGAGVVFQRRASLALHGWKIIAAYRRAA
ncbi:MAG: NlpC/P60 family protein [Rhodocyclaceae bacterium]|nr:NlpC/P60 family protein [Rhodocyclaceae bacterium]